jgi:hypothetical protein
MEEYRGAPEGIDRFTTPPVVEVTLTVPSEEPIEVTPMVVEVASRLMTPG